MDGGAGADAGAGMDGGAGTSGDAAAGAGGGAGASGAAGATGDGGPPSCGNYAASAPAITPAQVSQPMPTQAQGGTIAAGTYFLTSATYYQGGTAPSSQNETLYFNANGTIAGAILLNSGPFVISGTYTTSGTDVIVHVTCPSNNGSSSTPYTATSTTFTVYDQTTKSVDVFTKQ